MSIIGEIKIKPEHSNYGQFLVPRTLSSQRSMKQEGTSCYKKKLRKEGTQNSFVSKVTF